MLRRAAPPSILATLAVVAACGPPPAPPPPRPFARAGQPAADGRANSAGGEAARRTGARLRRGITAPAVDAAPECPMGVDAALQRFRINGRPFHFGPLCTASYSGEWAAVLVTGTEREASDVWVVVRGPSGVEPHRVGRAPVGVRYTAGTISGGFAYLVGESLETDEMPASADVLVSFAVPWPGGADPEVLDLSPVEVPLLGARDRPELERRLAQLAPSTQPPAGAVQSLFRRVREGGPRLLIGALPSSGGVPVLRAWQAGVYERVAVLHAELDPSNARVTNAFELLRALGEAAECGADRCAAAAAPRASETHDAAVQPQFVARADGVSTVAAAIIDAGRRPEGLAAPTPDRVGAPAFDAAEDRAIAEGLTLEGTVDGRVTAVTRGQVRVLAWAVDVAGARRTSVYVVRAGRAPRRIEDRVIAGLLTPSREVMLRDVDANTEPEVVTIARPEGGTPVVTVSTIRWPPAVVDRSTLPRLDAMRAVLGARDAREFDRMIRGFAPPLADRDATCASLDRLASPTARAIADATAGTFVAIEYPRAGMPLVGTVQRLRAQDVRRATDGNALLGPFVGARCGDLVCDFFQGFCRRGSGDGEQGYLWLSGRRATPLWGVSRRARP